MQPITARPGFVAEIQTLPAFAQACRPLAQKLGTVIKNAELADLAAPAALGDSHPHRRLVHIQPDMVILSIRPVSLHEALCRSSGTTLDILHAERRAADHSANIGSRALSPTIPAISMLSQHFSLPTPSARY
jgi:hypothetical protein